MHVVDNILPTGSMAYPQPEYGLLEEHALYQALVASLSDMGEGLMILENRRFSFVNNALCRLTGFTAAELLAYPVFIDIFHPDEQGRVLENHRRRLMGEVFNTFYETALHHKDGSRIDVDISVAFLRMGMRVGVVVTVRDIRKRKQAEAEVRHKTAELEALANKLEEKVRERTSDLEYANRELTRLNQVKSDFISIVSHELRTPLTSIKSFAEILLDDEHDSTTRSRYLAIINSETDRLARLINDVLDLQKIDSGKMNWSDEMVNLTEVAQSSIEVFSGAYQEKGLSIQFSTDDERMMVYAEQDRMHQVFSNLLSNAHKFTDHGAVSVKLRRVQIYREDVCEPMLQITIADTGIGIPSMEIERVFERFYQVDSTHKRKQGGAGLGLSICREIIQHYRGNIQVQSALGEGTTVIVTLPEATTPRRKLGEVLLELGMLSHDDLSEALSRQTRP